MTDVKPANPERKVSNADAILETRSIHGLLLQVRRKMEGPGEVLIQYLTGQVACQYDPKTMELKRYYLDGTLKEEGFCDFTGDGEYRYCWPRNLSYYMDTQWKTYYPDGNLATEWVSTNKPGITQLKGRTGKYQKPLDQGHYKEYYPNGNLRKKGEYYLAYNRPVWDYAVLREGVWPTYYEDGTLASEIKYASKIEYNAQELEDIKPNQPAGTYKTYHPNGQPKEEGEYKIYRNKKIYYDPRSLKDGTWKTYDDQGRLIKEVVYGEKKLKELELEGHTYSYHDNGVVKNITQTFEGKEHGASITYNEIGQVLREEDYKKGKLKSAHVYHPSGNEVPLDAEHYVSPITVIEEENGRVSIQNQYGLMIGRGSVNGDGNPVDLWEFPDQGAKRFGWYEDHELIGHGYSEGEVQNHPAVQEIIQARAIAALPKAPEIPEIDEPEEMEDISKSFIPVPETPKMNAAQEAEIRRQAEALATHHLIASGLQPIPLAQKKSWKNIFGRASANQNAIIPAQSDVAVLHQAEAFEHTA